MRFFFRYPHCPKPSGGLKHLRLLVDVINEVHGGALLIRDAAAFPRSGDDDLYPGIAVPAATFAFEEAGQHLRADDVLVLPEVGLEQSLARAAPWSCRIGLYNQNGFYALRDRPARPALRRIEFALACSPYVAGVCQHHLGIAPARIFLLPYWVVRPPFAGPAPAVRPRLTVCAMPRKLPGHVRAVRRWLAQHHPAIPWVDIDGVTEPEVAQVFRQSAIYFSTQDREGFGLPALEAMACDCLVVGYRGTGYFPHPYATAGNGLWAADRSVPAAINALATAIRLLTEDHPALPSIRAACQATLGGFTREALQQALRPMLCQVTRGRYAQPAARPALGLRGHFHALHVLYQHQRLFWQTPASSRGRHAPSRQHHS